MTAAYKKMIISVLLALTAIMQAPEARSQEDGAQLAVVYSTAPGKNEIVIASPRAGLLFKMGDLVYIPANGKNVILSVTFPMQTVARCQVAKSHQQYFRDLGKGMPVYRYVPGDTLNAIQKDLGRIDEIRLYNGRVIQGAIISRGDEYLVLTVSGTVKIPEKQIKNVRIIR